MLKSKIKLLSISVGFAIALMGAGYAQWGDAITHNTTIETGKMLVVFEKDTQWGADATTSSVVQVIPPIMSEMVDDDAGGHGKVVDFEFKNVYPGATFTTKYEIRNRGTVPAKLQSVDVCVVNPDNNTTTPIDEFLTSSAISPGLKELIENITVSAEFNKHIGSGGDNVALGGFADVSLANLEAALEAKLSLNANAVLEPDAFIGLGLLQWPPSGAEIEPIDGFLFKVNSEMDNSAQGVKLPLRFVYNYIQSI